MPKKPKSLADYIIATKAQINKAAFQAGQFLYGIPTPKKSNSLSDSLPSENRVEAENVIVPSISELVPTAHNKQDDDFTKELMRFEKELAALREAYKKALDDVDRNALHFRILRIERARKKFLDTNQ